MGVVEEPTPFRSSRGHTLEGGIGVSLDFHPIRGIGANLVFLAGR